ncbi:MAG TPA: DNA-3-methyladenine glycosylase 2 family protein [Candidatus Bathyarchaeota archaeon]|nr:DNA-3-methyladenine glycosylase 2 family protein [Candidatus Bathyarchaeota archaeon]
METQRCLLRANPPFSLDLSMRATQPSAPATYENGVLTRALRLSNGRLIPVRLRQTTSTESPTIEVELLAKVDEEERHEITRMLDRFLCLSDDLRPAHKIMQKDPALNPILEKLRAVRPWTSLNAYESMICGVLFQQISLNAAFSIIRSLVQSLGDCVAVGGRTYYDFPRPEVLAEASVERLKACRLSRNKAVYVRGIAQAIVGGFDPEELGKMPVDEALEVLMGFKGIGRWTAELILATGLKRWEVVPADDLGIRRAISQFYLGGKTASASDVRKVAENWGQYKWPIAYYLLVASERMQRL